MDGYCGDCGQWSAFDFCPLCGEWFCACCWGSCEFKDCPGCLAMLTARPR